MHRTVVFACACVRVHGLCQRWFRIGWWRWRREDDDRRHGGWWCWDRRALAAARFSLGAHHEIRLRLRDARIVFDTFVLESVDDPLHQNRRRFLFLAPRRHLGIL